MHVPGCPLLSVRGGRTRSRRNLIVRYDGVGLWGGRCFVLGLKIRDRVHLEAIMTGNSSIVYSDPDILGGIPVFVGTRVPLRNLIDYLDGNYSLNEFLDSFPTVSREQAVAALESAHDAVSALAYSANRA